MKKLCLITMILFGLAVFSANAADLTETLTFEWDQTDTTNLKEWRLYWGDAPGGPYAEEAVTVIPYPGPVVRPIPALLRLRFPASRDRRSRSILFWSLAVIFRRKTA